MADSDVETEYELESFVINDIPLEITTIAYLPIELLMANREKQTEISGQKLWCGSLGVIQYLLNNPATVNNNLIIELGAGTGVLGMICRKLGAKSVLLTDHDIISIKHMNDDCARNRIDAVVKRLDWYNPSIADWGVDALVQDSGELVIAAGDVLYKEALLEPFFKTAIMLLQQHENSSMLLCHIPRAGVDHAKVEARAAAVNLHVEYIPAELWNTGDCFKYCDPDDLCRAKLYRIRLAK